MDDGLGNSIRHAFLSVAGKAVDLNDLVGPDSGLLLNIATSINDRGQIVGYASDKGGRTHEFLLTPTATPEPSTLLFSAMVASILGLRASRRSGRPDKGSFGIDLGLMILRPGPPTELGRRRSRVRPPLLGRRPDDLGRDRGIRPVGQAFLEGRLHPPVLSRVEREDRHPPPRLEARGQGAEEGFEGRRIRRSRRSGSPGTPDARPPRRPRPGGGRRPIGPRRRAPSSWRAGSGRGPGRIAPASSSARGSSAFSSRIRARPGTPRLDKSSEADRPREGFIRMSSGPSPLKVNPRAGSSICIDESPRSASRTSAPPGASATTNGATPAKFIRPDHGPTRPGTQRVEPGLSPGQFDRIPRRSRGAAPGLDGG